MEFQDGAELCFPQLNKSCQKPKPHQSDFVLLYLMFFISALTVILSLLVIISVSHFRQLHTPTNLLLLSLAVSDFCVGLVVTPLQIYRQITCWFLGNSVCSLQGYVSFSIISASVGGMVLISIDRYVAICDPLHYSTRVTVGRAMLWVGLCWFFSFFYNILLFNVEMVHPGQLNSRYGMCEITTSLIIGGLDGVLTFIIPFISIVILYIRVFLTAASQARAMRSHVAGTVVSKKSELKAARTLGIVVAWFLICFSPYYFLSMASINLPPPFTVFLLCLSPFLNPVIYALFYPWFRKALRLIFSLQILQPGSCETNML